MLVICEGVDGGGKSTLVNALAGTYMSWCIANDVGFSEPTILRFGQPEPGISAFDEYELPLHQSPLRDLVTSTTELVLADRYSVGEPFYGPLYRGGSRLSPGGVLHVELLLQSVGAVKLLAQPDDVATVRKRLAERGEDFLMPHHVDLVHRQYEVHGRRYAYQRAEQLPLMSTISTAHLRQRQRLDSIASMLPGYVGSLRPRVVLVGDRRNDRLESATPEFNSAFIPCVSGSSSSYLMSALNLTGIYSSNLGIVNAHEPGVDLSLLLDVGTIESVVALGNEASTALSAAGVTHAKVPHPQWWRRFRHSKLSEYANEIMEVARGDHS